MINPATDRVLITGAAGAIGTALRNGLRARLAPPASDRQPGRSPIPHRTRSASSPTSRDRAAIERMMEGVAAVVHLAGVGGDYTLEDLFRVNARGMFDVFEAARLAGVQRIVFASSNHAFGCYPIDGARLPCPAAAPRQPVRHVQGLGRDHAALLLRSPRHPLRVAAHRHVSHAADRSALARHLAVARRRGAAGRLRRCAIPIPAVWW